MNIRQACLDNIGPLTSAARVAAASHGDADHPQQPAPNAPNGGSLEMLNSFSRIRVALTFLDDGLHAVLEIDRR